MKTLGLIGGISTFSTSAYYSIINRLTNERLGGSSSARMILYSLNFQEFKILQEANDWKQMEQMLSDIAQKLVAAGADCLLICSNTPHIIADELRQKIKIPLLHIAEETAREIRHHGISRVALLGTKFTMEQSFFKDRLTRAGIEVIIPDSSDRELIHASIINEFTKGLFLPETKSMYQAVIRKLQHPSSLRQAQCGAGSAGAEAVIFGCTEISLLLSESDCEIKVFDTTAIHCKAAVDFSLSEQ
jgi:aspartate racemase